MHIALITEENDVSDDTQQNNMTSNSMIAKPAFGRSDKEQYQMTIRRAINTSSISKKQKAAQHSIYEIIKEIKNFEDDLTEDEEAFMAIIGGPSGSAIFLNGIIPLGLDKVVFIGQDQSGKKARLIQHVSQINIMLQSMPIAKEVQPRRFGIGFHAHLDDDDDENEKKDD